MKFKKTIAVIIGIIVFALLTIYLFDLNTSSKPLSKDGKYVATNEAVIKKEIWAQLDPDKQHIQSITLQPKTARGEYGQGWFVEYYTIECQAFANGDEDYSMLVNLEFTYETTDFFDLGRPHPYYDNDQELIESHIEVEHTDAPQWEWKIEEEKREVEEEERKAEERVRKFEEYQKKLKEEEKRKEPLVKEWVTIHEVQLKQAIYNMLLKDEPKVAEALGEIEAVEMQELLSTTDVNHGYELLLHLQFKNCPEEKVKFSPFVEFEDTSFQDLTKGGEMHSGSVYYVIDFEEGSKIHDLTDTIQIKVDDNPGIRID